MVAQGGTDASPLSHGLGDSQAVSKSHSPLERSDSEHHHQHEDEGKLDQGGSPLASHGTSLTGLPMTRARQTVRSFGLLKLRSMSQKHPSNPELHV
jgi:hypothetical protein